MSRKGHDLEFIQSILGHDDPDMTLTYIEPCNKTISKLFDNLWKGVKNPKFKDDVTYGK